MVKRANGIVHIGYSFILYIIAFLLSIVAGILAMIDLACNNEREKNLAEKKSRSSDA